MKDWKEIENCSDGQLEKEAMGQPGIPRECEERLLQILTAAALLESSLSGRKELPDGKTSGARPATGTRPKHRATRFSRTGKWLLPVSVAAAAAVALLLTLSPPVPQDTFTDPALAYAEVERTFAFISEKMNRGLDLAREAETSLETSLEIFYKTIK